VAHHIIIGGIWASIKDGAESAFCHIFSGIIKKSAGHSVYDRHLIRDSWPMGFFF